MFFFFKQKTAYEMWRTNPTHRIMLGAVAVAPSRPYLERIPDYIIAYLGYAWSKVVRAGSLDRNPPGGTLQGKGRAGRRRDGGRLQGGGRHPRAHRRAQDAAPALRRDALLPSAFQAGGAGDGLPRPRERRQGLRHLPGRRGAVHRSRVR